jgi:crotonobetainyl-CoA:carnitine CoA-transferase CaiB-like acyl-CoA transferase
MADGKDGPLTGVRVLDLTTVLMGPFASQLLGDLGADVIKVEAPGGDSTRNVGVVRNAGMSAFFLHANRNKRSIVVDLQRAGARELMLKLAADTDVFLTSLRPRALKKLGLAYEDLRSANEAILYAGLVGYGSGGPYAGKPAYDDLIQSASGLAGLFQRAANGAPRYVPSAIADRIVGQAAANAILAGLLHRERTGHGQAIEIPMFETMVHFTLGDHMNGLTFDPPEGAVGYPRLLAENRRPYATLDGFVAVLPYNDGQWRRFFAAAGQADRIDGDPRFATLSARTENTDALYDILAEIVARKTSAEWLAILTEADVPVMTVHSMESLVDDPHLNAVGFFDWMDHPTEGKIRTMAPAGTYSETPLSVRRPTPLLGEHTKEILTEAGLDEDEIERLAAGGVIAGPDSGEDT